MTKKQQYTAYYDPNDVHVFVGKEEVGAFADNSMVQVQWRNDRQSLVVDPKGVGSLVRNNDRSGTVTISLSETSIWNAKLTELVASGKPFSISIYHNKEVISAATAQVQKVPDITFGNSGNDRTWQILAPVLDITNKNL
ncbi:phage structural protein [Weissella sp. MSCH1]|uniref:phage structural protein n=1 Tax=Weissella sp. MSCH1 TaxID=3383343 RepID=UPI00389694A1